jgi:multisubunit Na+/H+ antiporter MnhG subunit
MSGYFSDHQKLAENATRYSGTAQGAYITLNPVKAALLARAANRMRVAGKDCSTADAEIIKRRWLAIADRAELSCSRRRDERQDAL